MAELPIKWRVCKYTGSNVVYPFTDDDDEPGPGGSYPSYHLIDGEVVVFIKGERYEPHIIECLPWGALCPMLFGHPGWWWMDKHYRECGDTREEQNRMVAVQLLPEPLPQLDG